MNPKGLALLAALSVFAAARALAQEAGEEIDNGTNPTRLSRSAIVNYEHVDLFDGYTSEAIKLTYSQPFGRRREYSIQFKLPLTSVDSRGDDAFGHERPFGWAVEFTLELIGF